MQRLLNKEMASVSNEPDFLTESIWSSNTSYQGIRYHLDYYLLNAFMAILVSAHGLNYGVDQM